MQIRVDKLRRYLALLQPVVPRNPTLPVLRNIRLKNGQLTATDLESTVVINLSKASKEAFLVPHKTVTEVLKFVPGDEVLTLGYEGKAINSGGTLKLSWSGGAAAYPVPDVSDYPDIGEKKPEVEASLNGDMLVGAMVTARQYCAIETTRPVLNGIALYLGDVLQVAGADGFRLSFQSLKLSYPLQETIIIPANTVSVLEHLWHKEPGQPSPQNTLVGQLTAARQLKLSLWKETMSIQFGNITLVSKLIEGKFPDVLALLNNFQEPIKVRLMAPEMHNAVRRLQRIASDGTGIVRLQWTDAVMILSAKNEESGEVRAEIAVEAGSIPGRIALNVKYLLEYLEGKDGLIALGTVNEHSPALFHYGAKPIVAIMPMNVQWGDEQPAAEKPKTEVAEGEPQTVEENPESPEPEEDLTGGKNSETEQSGGPSQELVTVEGSAAEVIEGASQESGETKKSRKPRGKRKKNPET